MPDVPLDFYGWAVRIHNFNPVWLAPSNREVALPYSLLKLQPGTLKPALLGPASILASRRPLKRQTGSGVKNHGQIRLCGTTNDSIESTYRRSSQPAAVALIREARVIEAVAEDHIPLR